jgi:hypothetical protein
MGNNDLSNNENILVKIDHNNLIYVDPNSVVNNGEVEPRGVKQENLVMYVNLEADLVPRTTLVADGDKNTLFSVAKGTINLLRNQKDRDYDTTWSDAYFNVEEKTTKDIKGNLKGTGEFFQSDGMAQSFGIDSINITTKGLNSIPQVTINFIDVRGKTLFESPENSPYKAFFHLPWPIFYLTVKGYYGKAIRYRLHMVKFSTKYNENNGNFEITTNFVGSTFAYLNDIPINGILNSPYMYMIEEEVSEKTLKDGVEQIKVKKSSKGYSMLRSIYNEYKQKGLIDKNFPVRTLRELIEIAKSLDKTLEREIFAEIVDMKIFSGVKDFEQKVVDFETAVESWAEQYLTFESFSILESNSLTIGTGTNVKYFYIKGPNKTIDKSIIGSEIVGTLEKIIKENIDSLDKIQFSTNSKVDKKIKFTEIKANSYVKYSNGIKQYHNKDKDGKIGVAIDKLIEDIRKIINQFNKQKLKLQGEVEAEMNTIVRDPTKGIGFNPTIRNIFAVVLANAEVYIRLMKDVHTRAFDKADERKELLKGFSDETPGGSSIYPWPEVKKSAGSGSKHKVIVYPGDKDLAQQLQSRNPELWPEVDFIENYQAIATKKFDTLSDNEGGVGKINYVFESNQPEDSLRKISSLNNIIYGNPYINKSIVSILYEIFERSYYITLIDSFNDATIKELANIEFKNLEESIKEDFDVMGFLQKEIKDSSSLYLRMVQLSIFEKYPYLKDQLPTIPYLNDSLNSPFSIEQYVGTISTDHDTDYPKLEDNLKNYAPESYRKNIYPFNSSLYLNYLNQTTFSDDEFKFGEVLNVNTQEAFISSPIDPTLWVKDGSQANLFKNDFNLSGKTVNILNTPYFHKQLQSEFGTSENRGKYVGSSYLLLNSLPFKDLDDSFLLSKIKVSSLFREIGSTHFVPYHLILKWGSLYHRYKKQIIDGVDILDGFLTALNKTESFDGNMFFDNYSGTTFSVLGTNITYSNHKDVGVHPVYDAIFHQIINGYTHYDVLSGNTSFSAKTNNGSIVMISGNTNGQNYWTNFVDNSKYDGSLRYTILPSDGSNLKPTNDNFFVREQRSMRSIWKEEVNNVSFSGLTFPAYNEYDRTYVSGSTRATDDNKFGISTNYRKVIDLIATFSPDILNQFEDMFLTFASNKLDEEIEYKQFGNVSYYQFQDILKDISTVEKLSTDTTNIQQLIVDIKNRQDKKLVEITNKILRTNNLLSFTVANPKEIDAHVIGGFAEAYPSIIIDNNVLGGNTFSYATFNISQIAGNSKYIKLYVGEDVDGNYLQFFATNDVELSEENVLTFRPLILLFAGLYSINPSLTKIDFQKYLRDNVLTIPTSRGIKLTKRHALFLDTLIPKFSGFKFDDAQQTTEKNGYNDDPLKLETYSYFKSFNDKWIGGNSIGQRTLLEEFLFLDKSNKDIGNIAYLNLERLISIGNTKNQNTNLYGVISMLIQGTGFDMRALPSYVNFYGANYGIKAKPTPSKTLAKNLFGTFLEVDYQESSPKIIIQYTGPTSKHLDLSKYSKEYKFVDDSFNMGNINNHPLVLTAPEVFNTGDLYRSNRVVAFEVSFGDQYQSIFKGVQLDQASIKNTTEAFIAQENLARAESGANAYQVDIGLFDIYRQSSYTCAVTCMGNVMIQPTMYFYLKNIPMFKGSYWIKEVTHNIKGNSISTTFTGVRIPYASLPDPKDSFMATYKPFFDAITNKAIIRQNKIDKNPTLQKSIKTNDGKNVSIIVLNKETLNNIINRSGISDYGIPFNGGGINQEQYIQLIKYNGEEWLEAVAVEMGGSNYTPPVPLSIFNKVTNPPTNPLYFSELNKDSQGNYRDLDFYATRFQLDTGIPNMLTGCTTDFFNPKNGISRSGLESSNQLISTPRRATGAVHVGPNSEEYGIALSRSLMTKLKLVDGDVVYFKIRNDKYDH